MKKAAVFCSHGLGDGLIFLIISYNLYRNGYEVDTYHPSLFEMQRWFDYTNLKKEPSEDKIEEVLSQYDLIIINSDFRKINKEIKKKAFEKFESKTFDLHPTTCKGKGKPIGCKRFDFQKTINQNLVDFCEKILKLKNVIKDNGIKIPKDLTHRKFINRIVIHPTSNDPQKNWPIRKFLKLSNILKSKNFDPKFLIAKYEMDSVKNFLNDFEDILSFSNLDEIASYIYESGYKIGNDSGIGHLASNLKIPTLTIFSTRRKQKFWRPDFYLNRCVVSFPLINIKGCRLREKFWEKTISSKKVFKNFQKLLIEEKNKKL